MAFVPWLGRWEWTPAAWSKREVEAVEAVVMRHERVAPAVEVRAEAYGAAWVGPAPSPAAAWVDLGEPTAFYSATAEGIADPVSRAR